MTLREMNMGEMDSPNEYDFLKIAIQRGLVTEQDEIAQFKRIESGRKGENAFAEIIKQFAQENWLFKRNLWLHDFSDFECDYLLITTHCVYVFEIKNYFGKFEYRNGQCKSRGVAITYNPVNQAHNATIHLRNLLGGVPVKGVLVFIGEHNQVVIHDDIDYIDILCRNDVYQYIQDIISEEKQSQMRIDSQSIISKLRSHKINNPYAIEPFASADMTEENSGIFCDRCGAILTMTRKIYINCQCGFEEYREHLIIRSACEYSLLTYGTNFTVSAIHNFLGNVLSRSYLKSILQKYFTSIPNQKVLTFKNSSQNNVNQNVFDKPNRIILHQNRSYQ